MPQNFPIITGEDGRKYYDVPGSARKFPVEEIDGKVAASDDPSLSDADHPYRAMAKGFVKGAVQSPTAQFLKRSSPEIGAGLAAILGPETGGASFAIPPLVAGATDAARQYFDTGSVDPMAVATRTGLNAIPGAIGKMAGRFLPGSGTLTRAVEGAAQGDGWMGTVAKGLKGALGGQATPAVQIAQAGGKANAPSAALIAQLEAKLTDPQLNVTAKAAVLTALKQLQGRQSGNIAQGLRGVLGLGEGVTGER